MNEHKADAPEQERESAAHGVSDTALRETIDHLREGLKQEQAMAQRYRHMHREAEQALLGFRRQTSEQIRSLNEDLARQIEKVELLTQQLGVQDSMHAQALEVQRKEHGRECNEMQKQHERERDAMQIAFDDLASRYDTTATALTAAKADSRAQQMKIADLEERLRNAQNRSKSLEAALHRKQVMLAMEGAKQRMLEILAQPKRSPQRKSFFEAQKSICAELEGTALFDTAWYLETYPDLAASKLTPLQHYVQYGCWEARNPSPEFNTLNYYLEHPEVAERGECALFHYAREKA